MKKTYITREDIERAQLLELTEKSKIWNFYQGDLSKISRIYSTTFVSTLINYLNSKFKTKEKWNQLIDWYYLHGDFEHFKDVLTEVTYYLNSVGVAFVLDIWDDIS